MLLRLARPLVAFYLRLLGARRHVLEAGPVSLVYYAIGPAEGEPWLVLHGLGSIAASWSPVMRRLRRGCRLLVPELSALGGTVCPDDGFGIAGAVEILGALLDREAGGRPVTLLGLSLGGWMAVRLALAQPERIARLALVDIAGYHDQDWERIRSLVEVRDLAGVDRLYKALFVETPWLMSLSRATFLNVYTSRAVRNVLAGLTEADTFDDADLGTLGMPAVVIWAEEDGLFTVKTGRAIAAALPRARLEIVPHCGHAIHMERPRALNAALQRFRHATAPGLQYRRSPGGKTWPAPSI
jgi:pimeloyl-ACP methyl ester carboxylesterase